MSDKSDEAIETMMARTRELVASGMEHIEASELAQLEMRIAAWPPAHGDDLEILIFGDFRAPQDDFPVPELGITVYKEPVKKSFIRALLVLKAHVTVAAKTVEALQDATRRINLLLGINALVNWGNAGAGWWSWVAHGTGGGVMPEIDHKESVPALRALLSLDPRVRRKVDAALFWIREPRALVTDSPRVEVLRVFSAYWNAFECLVDAVCFFRPMKKMSKPEKQAAIDALLHARGGKLTPEDVYVCYNEIVDPRFKAKARHALAVCFGDESEHYFKECFALPSRERTLYQIRNSIDHGDIDASDAAVLHMVEARLRVLWMIVWRMFGRLIPFGAPADSRIPPT